MLKKVTLSAVVSVSILAAGCSTTSAVQNEAAGPVSQTSTSQAALNTLYQYSVINSKTKQSISASKLAVELKDTDVIFMGEYHSHQGAHKLQLDLLEALHAQNPNIILSMEQFGRDVQPIVDGYLSGEYGENTLIDDGKAWPHYKGSYRAIVEFAKDNNIPVVAANAPAMFVRCVGKKGPEVLDTIAEDQQSWSARKLDLANEHYKAKFMSFMKESGSRHGQTEEVAKKRMMNTYAAQLLRDTTMAESIDAAMKKNPNHQVIHLNGAFHSNGHLGTAAIIETMDPELTVSVMSPVMVADHLNPAATDEDFAEGDYVYLLKSMPERYIDKEKEKASINKLIRERMSKKCEL
ncbi:MAG: hypothetical protein DRQ47_08790 [Gammaproteobacteria bacterium]|nr:MAG: hypothetical protein DRQ47_08790 [Gammaproteobacteria bacterium]